MSETSMRISWDLHAELSKLKQEKQQKEKRQVSFEEVIWNLIKKEVEATV